MTTTAPERPRPAVTPARPVAGRVARVLSARELVINVGSDAGVTEGTRFKVLAEGTLEVTDPETGETLGAIDQEKTRVEAIDVRPRLTVCRTYRTVNHPTAYWLPELTGVARMFPPVGRPERLHVRDATLPPPLPAADNYVKAGDPVVTVDDPTD